METVIDEQVKVWVSFDRGLFPIAMNWRKKLIKFRKVIFTWSKYVGNTKLINLICASDTSNFNLEYNTNDYSWKVKKVMPKE